MKTAEEWLSALENTYNTNRSASAFAELIRYIQSDVISAERARCIEIVRNSGDHDSKETIIKKMEGETK